MANDEWQCPLCGQPSDQPSAHMRQAHLGGADPSDRLGLRRALDRPPRRAPRQPSRREPREGPPPPPTIEMPAEGALLRLTCVTPLEHDALDLRLALVDLPGVRAVGIDLALGAIDLEIAPEVRVPQHVLQLAAARCRLPVLTAELHTLPASGDSPDSETLLAVLQ